MHSPPRLRAAAATWLLTAGLFAQAGPTPVGPVSVGPDPYTEGEQQALDRAGYVRFAPFQVGADHTTAQVQDLLRDEPLIWIETEHFRLGCALPAVKLAGGGEPWRKEWRRSVKAELKELKKLLPRVKTSARELDPWLRAHLFALRLEKVYAEVARTMSFSPPKPPEDGGRRAPVGPVSGPFLGMTEKPVVLLLRRAANHARYTRAYQGIEMTDPIRHHDAVRDCMVWSASEETAEGLYTIDLALHAQMVFNVAHNLYSGYLGYRRALPPWLVTGLGHWHERRVTGRFPTFDRRDRYDQDPRSTFWQWEERAPGLARNRAFEPLEKLVALPHAGGFTLEQHMHAWAVVDHLARADEAALFRFVRLVKVSGTFQDQAFEEAFGADYATVDAAFLAALEKRR